MLGRLKMDIDECILAYSELMRTIFDNKLSWLPKLQTGSQFDSAKLESAIKRVITSHGASETALFNDKDQWTCGV